MSHARVYICVSNHKGETIDHADVRLKPPKGKAITIGYAPQDACYISEPLPHGSWTLTVKARGFLPDRLSLELEGTHLRAEVTLGKKGMPYYLQNGRRCYFETEPGQVAALVRPIIFESGAEPTPAPSAAFKRLQGLEAKPESLTREEEDVHSGDSFKVFTIAKAGVEAVGSHDPEQDLLEAPEVLDQGPLLQGEDRVRFLSAMIQLETQEGIDRVTLARLLRPFHLEVIDQDPRNPTHFTVRCCRVPDQGFGQIPEQLVALPEIHWANSIIQQEDTPCLTPADNLFLLQFHTLVTKVDEAWDWLTLKGINSFGSADIVVGIHDDGILTTASGAAITHPEFSGTVAGGALATRPGVAHRNKVLYTQRFTSPMVPHNDGITSSHGSWVGGTISASVNGAGTVGGAPNTRLTSHIADYANSIRRASCCEMMAGLIPTWRRGSTTFNAAENFPPALNSGMNATPGADIINCSHTFLAQQANFGQAMQRISLFGRNHRGTLVIAAAGNTDQNTRLEGWWGENVNVLRVSASALDLDDREVRMNYSSHAVPADLTLDVCAPSESQNFFPIIHRSAFYGFPATDLTTTSGNIPITTGLVAPITNSPVAGTNIIQVTAAQRASFPVGTTILISDRRKPLHVEIHQVSAPVPANPAQFRLNNNLGFSYSANQADARVLSGNQSYSSQFGGTSAATPQVSAVVALMLSINPSLSWLEVRHILRNSAVPISIDYRGFDNATGAQDRYRWIDATNTNLLDVRGLLNITGGNNTISWPATAGDSTLTIDNANTLVPRQAIVIGAETWLTRQHPIPATPNRINVDRSNEFEIGDVIHIGRQSRTVLIQPAAPGNTVIWVQSLDGFRRNDRITLGGGQTVQIQQDRTSPAFPTTRGAAITGFQVTAIPAGPSHARGTVVTHANTQFEGPFTVTGKGAGFLTLNNPVTRTHPANRIVRKQNTEYTTVIRRNGNSIDIEPLKNAHPLNSQNVEHIRIGRVAAFSYGFGYGRLNADRAVLDAFFFDHSLRDLVIRGDMEEDGDTKMGVKEVESPDIWVRNDAATPNADVTDIKKPGPHQHPRVTIDPPIHRGVGRNDLSVSGNCTSAAEITIVVTISNASANPATPDSFTWTRNGVSQGAAAPIPAGNRALSDGVSIRFAGISGHAKNDSWQIDARRITNRFLHLRTYNRGSQPYFTRSTNRPAGAPLLEVAQSRLLLCASDGYPVCRFTSIANVPGTNDMEVISAYTGANLRALYSVEITAAAAGGDTMRCWRDGTAIPGKTRALSAATLTETLNDGVQIRFGSHTGHQVGDRWHIYARRDTPYLNLDHFWDMDEVTAFDPSVGGRAGTRILGSVPISGLGATTAQINNIAWPENLRLPTNQPANGHGTRPLRLFALGEAVPHDGSHTGVTSKTNNNISYRELCFAKFSITSDDGRTTLDSHVDVDNLGTKVTRPFIAFARTTAGTFNVTKVKIELEAIKRGGTKEKVTYHHLPLVNSWSFDRQPTWATLAAPLEARRPDGTQPAASGEHYDISFAGTLTLDKTLEKVSLTLSIVSDFRDHAVASHKHELDVYVQLPMPTGVAMAAQANLPKPANHVFAPMAQLNQTAEQAYGPVVDANDADSETTRYRTTALFTANADTTAFAVCRGFVLVQPVSGNNNLVNLILKPLQQPLPGIVEVAYIVYRGLRLTDFIAGPANLTDLRARANSSPFITQVWDTWVILNPAIPQAPASALGFDPAQAVNTTLDAVFEGARQLPLVSKGMDLGRFQHAGNHAFGIEFVLRGSVTPPDLAFARLVSHEIDVSAMPSGNAAQRFALKRARERVLHFLDPAVFYGLHLHPGGTVSSGAQTHRDQAIVNQVLVPFHTKHRCYLDIRNENDDSLNFFEQYTDGNSNQIEIDGTAHPYATNSWPLHITDHATPVVEAASRLKLFLRLRVGDNSQGVVFLDHAIRFTGKQERFIHGANLVSPNQPWTEIVDLSLPHSGPENARQGVAWLLRVHYGRLNVANPPTPPPAKVLRTDGYSDNLFGPLQRVPAPRAGRGLQWHHLGHHRHVDAESVMGWRQMTSRGVARQANNRVLLYAVATHSQSHLHLPYVPTRPVPGGAATKGDFFDTRALFAAYPLTISQIDDNGTAVRMLRLGQAPKDGLPPSNVQLLGVSGAEFTTLSALALAGGYGDYLCPHTPVVSADPNGKSYTKYQLGLRGLDANGTYRTQSPQNPIHVYTLDGLFFYTAAFSAAQPLPSTYSRGFEEEKGARLRPALERSIASVDSGTNRVTLQNTDIRRDLVPGDNVKIDKSQGNNGQYPVTTVAHNGGNSVITLGNPGIGSSTQPLGSLFTLPKANEDYYIDLDQGGALSGVNNYRHTLTQFKAAIDGIANNAAARATLQARIDTFAPRLLRRAQLVASGDHAKAADAERGLYWARMRMGVMIKSHAYCLAAPGDRDLLLASMEGHTRGYANNFAGAPGGAHKILLLCFDPYYLVKGLDRGNSSAAAGLALHNQPLAQGAKIGRVNTIILPLRYEAFDGGLIERLVNPFLSGAGQIPLILTLGQGSEDLYLLGRFAARIRSGMPDNDYISKNMGPLGKGNTYQNFYEGTVPANQILPTTAANPQIWFHNQFYKASKPDSELKAAHKGGPNKPAKENVNITGTMENGSGGNWFSNELFYRVAYRHAQATSTTQFGMLHLPSAQGGKFTITQIIAELQQALQRWLGNRP